MKQWSSSWSLVAALAVVELPAQQPDLVRVVTGRVVDELGTPIRGAAVGALRWGDENTEELLDNPQATTASDGTYRLELSGASPQIAAIARGRMVCAVMANAPEVPDVRLFPGDVLTGQVLDPAGAPLAGARIIAREATPHFAVVRQTPDASTRTDRAGRFRLHGVATTGLHVFVSLAGYYSDAAFAHAGEPFVATLQPSGFVNGRVVDAQGRSLPGVTVRLGNGGWHAVSDEGGRFSLGVHQRGVFRVYGHGPERNRYFQSRPLAGPAEGIVLRERVFPEPPPCPPAAGIDPELLADMHQRLGLPEKVYERWLDITWRGPRPDGGPVLVSAHAATSAPAGADSRLLQASRPLGAEPSLRLGPLAAPGTYAIYVWRASRARHEAGSRFELGIVDVAGAELPLADTAMVLQRGKVEGIDGVLRARVAVIAHWRPTGVQRSPEPLHHPELAGLDRDGGFALDLPPGRWLLQLFDVATGIVFHTEPCPQEVAAGGPPLVLRPAPHRIEYELLADEADEPIECDRLDIALHAAPARGWAVVDPMHSSDSLPSAMTPRATLQFAGRAGVLLVPPGPLSLAAYRAIESDELPEHGSECAGGENVDVKVPVHRVRIELRRRR